MTRKIYRTAQGKMVDIGALYLKNENVRAVGNMNVNARGDVLDGNNRAIDTRNQQVARRYKKQATNVIDDTVDFGKKAPPPPPKAPAAKEKKVKPVAPVVPEPPEDFDDEFVKKPEDVAPATNSGGLAAAIAKARSIRQEPLKPSSQVAREQPGVKKI
jgi:hypothetical protein